MSVEYSSPNQKDICVAFCYYNPTNNATVLKNVLEFQAKLKAASIPQYSIELVAPGSKAALENPTVLLESTSSLFYKESLWNLLEKQIPSSYTKVCFMET
jgi:hypothetical protein